MYLGWIYGVFHGVFVPLLGCWLLLLLLERVRSINVAHGLNVSGDGAAGPTTSL